MAEAYIVAAVRTASGRRGGRLAGWHPVDLAATVIDAVLVRTGADPALVDDVILGCVSQLAEQSSNVARNAVLASALPESVPGTTIDRQCGSSQQALHFAAQAVMAGVQHVVIAGGVESMTRVPMGSPGALGEQAGLGTYMSPVLTTRYGPPFSQFTGAEALARKYGLDRESLDRYALRSHQNAAAAISAAALVDEIVPVAVKTAAGEITEAIHDRDEGVRADATLESIGAVRTLAPDGVITAANASQISDGASAVMVVSDIGLRALGIRPLARIHQMTVIGHDPVIMLEAPLPATTDALRKAGMRISDIDLFEVNEAFASVPLAWLAHCDADPERLNVHGGAIALGHPLGASGTRLMTTLVHALARTGGRYGLQTMCEGGGMANVTLVERL